MAGAAAVGSFEPPRTASRCATMTIMPSTSSGHVRLAPHRTLLRLGPAARMIGLDPAAALVVDELPPALAGMLDALREPVDPGALVSEAVRGGADPDQAATLLRRLRHAGAVVDAAGPRRRADRRAASVAFVHGDGPLAVGIATGLALAGVGAVHVAASGTVVAADLGTGHLDADRGHERGPAVATAVNRLVPTTRTGPLPQRVQPDIAVLADAVVPDPDRVAALMADGTAHLLVRLRDGAGVVGPLVLPHRSPCLRCLDLHRHALDPAWPHAAALLTNRCGTAEPSCISATVALGTAQALAAIDGGPATAPPPALGATLIVDPATATLHRQPWTAHPDCTCRAHTPCGDTPDRGTIPR